jgi:hypothetical protein
VQRDPVHPRTLICFSPPEKLHDACRQNSSPMVNFLSITCKKRFLDLLRTNFTIHIYKPMNVNLKIFIFPSAMEAAVDLEARPCSAAVLNARPCLVARLLGGATSSH